MDIEYDFENGNDLEWMYNPDSETVLASGTAFLQQDLDDGSGSGDIVLPSVHIAEEAPVLAAPPMIVPEIVAAPKQPKFAVKVNIIKAQSGYQRLAALGAAARVSLALAGTPSTSSAGAVQRSAILSTHSASTSSGASISYDGKPSSTSQETLAGSTPPTDQTDYSIMTAMMRAFHVESRLVNPHDRSVAVGIAMSRLSKVDRQRRFQEGLRAFDSHFMRQVAAKRVEKNALDLDMMLLEGEGRESTSLNLDTAPVVLQPAADVGEASDEEFMDVDSDFDTHHHPDIHASASTAVSETSNAQITKSPLSCPVKKLDQVHVPMPASLVPAKEISSSTNKKADHLLTNMFSNLVKNAKSPPTAAVVAGGHNNLLAKERLETLDDEDDEDSVLLIPTVGLGSRERSAKTSVKLATTATIPCVSPDRRLPESKPPSPEKFPAIIKESFSSKINVNLNAKRPRTSARAEKKPKRHKTQSSPARSVSELAPETVAKKSSPTKNGSGSRNVETAAQEQFDEQLDILRSMLVPRPVSTPRTGTSSVHTPAENAIDYPAHITSSLSGSDVVSPSLSSSQSSIAGLDVISTTNSWSTAKHSDNLHSRLESPASSSSESATAPRSPPPFNEDEFSVLSNFVASSGKVRVNSKLAPKKPASASVASSSSHVTLPVSSLLVQKFDEPRKPSNPRLTREEQEQKKIWEDLAKKAKK